MLIYTLYLRYKPNEMENTETKNVGISELLKGNYTPEPETPAVPETTPEPTPAPEMPESPAIDDGAVLSYLKDKGLEVESLDDLKKPTYDSILDDDEKAYLEFKKQTGGSKEDFEFSKTNFDEKSEVDVIRTLILKETGIETSDNDIFDYVDAKIGVDMESEDLSLVDKIKLNKFIKGVKTDLKNMQSKYTAKPEPANTTEFVELDNGIRMSKSDYDKQLKNHDNFKAETKKAVDGVTDFSFGLKINDNGAEQVLDYKFELSDADRQSMLSITEDVSQYVQKNYSTKDGFKNKEFASDLFWISPKNRERVISSLLSQARADAIDEVMKLRGNVNLQPHARISSAQPKDGTKIVSVQELLNR